MNTDCFAVYCDSVKLADDMALGTALLFVEAYFQKYPGNRLKLTIQRKDDDRVCCDKEVSERF